MPSPRLPDVHTWAWDRFSPSELDPGRLAASRTGHPLHRNPALTGRRFLCALCNLKRADPEPRRPLPAAGELGGINWTICTTRTIFPW